MPKAPKFRKSLRKETRLREIAAELHSERQEFEDAISLCEYVSRKMGTELTIEDADKVEEFMAALMEEEAERNATASIKAVTVIACKEDVDFEIRHCKTYNDNPEGNLAARAIFAEWVREAQADNDLPDEECLTDSEIEELFDQGRYEFGWSIVLVVRSI